MMPKEWIINQANMRWGLNKKNKVGAVSEEIRKCRPSSLVEWEDYYYGRVYPREHLVELGRQLYEKVTGICRAEIESITKEDCINFVIGLVIQRTYDGYQSEIQTVYQELQQELGVKIEAAPDEWDRGYNVDYFIRIDDKYIGLQIVPAGYPYLPQIILELELAKQTHQKFTDKYGGRVFYVISIKQGDKKVIDNREVIGEIREEIDRLRRA